MTELIIVDLFEALGKAHQQRVEDASGDERYEVNGAPVTRYNGGWIKTVTGLDKSKQNGYSILGEFAQTGMRPCKPGLYLDCSVAGSRKNQEKHYHVFRLYPDGSVDIIAWLRNGQGDWAVRLWQPIEAGLPEAMGAAVVALGVGGEPVDGWDRQAQEAFDALTNAEAADLLEAHVTSTRLVGNTAAHLLAAARRLRGVR